MMMDVQYASSPRESMEEADKRLKRPGGVLMVEKSTIEMMRQVALTEIEEERQKWEQEKKKVTTNVLKSQKILLDVGGYKYTTSLTTLTSIDHSMLASMFSGRYELCPDPVDGSIFIDRDGRPFKYVLSYLRDPLNFELPTKLEDLKDLLKEAQYYSLKELEARLSAVVNELDISLNPPLHYIGERSFIMDTEMERTLAKMFWRKVHLRMIISSEDEIDYDEEPSLFSRIINTVGRILVVIKSSKGHVFGAYVHDVIGTSRRAWQYGSCKNFVFALGNLTGHPMKLIREEEDRNVFRFAGIFVGPLDQKEGGLMLGSDNANEIEGHDLQAFVKERYYEPGHPYFGPQCTPVCFTNFAPGYTPVELLPGTLCGTPGNDMRYTPEMIEVYTVSFA